MHNFHQPAHSLFKKLDIYVVRSYIGPFVVTFFITLFVFVMQFFWLYMDELIGKGLGGFMILKLLVLMSATLVPNALPMGVLLGSIMTFGGMGENFELVAVKSTGISLNRTMRPLLFFTMFLAVLAFFFNNNVIPVANLKAYSLLYDLRNSTPTLSIRPGQFNTDIDKYAIRIGEKDRDGVTIRDIVIYDQSDRGGDTKIVLAKKGQMIPAKQSLIFRLEDGWRYEEGQWQDGRTSRTQQRIHFGRWDKVFDLSSLGITHTNEDLFKSSRQMMNWLQLQSTIDSVENKVMPRIAQGTEGYVHGHVSLIGDNKYDKRTISLKDKIVKQTTPAQLSYKGSFAEVVPDSLKPRLIQSVRSNNKNLVSLIELSVTEKASQLEMLRKFRIEYHKKFTLSFACILLFLIGAPLGAIIRKGGLGLPMVFGIVFFLFWYIMSIVGEKLAVSGALPAWAGMWLSTAALLPIAIVMIRGAKNDSKLFNAEWYSRMWKRITPLFTKKKKTVA